jgi:hypothetical protein
MKHISRRTLIRAAGAALALPLLKSMVPQVSPALPPAPLKNLAPVTKTSAKAVYRRVPGGCLLFEDEVGLRYGISKDRKEVLRYSQLWRRPGQPRRWESIKGYKGAYAAAMIEELLAAEESQAPEVSGC